jgi:GntR family transcriptional regulator/MocR family aminotransferase
MQTNFFANFIPIFIWFDAMLIENIKFWYDERCAEVRESGAPLVRYSVLFDTIRDAIEDGDLLYRVKLPPTRALSKALGLSRSTVVKAYDMLAIEGFVDVVQGSGYTINPDSLMAKIEAEPSNTSKPIQSYPNLAASAQAFLETSSRINGTDQKSVAFRPGIPPLDIFPVGAWRQITNAYWRNIRLTELSYSPSSGMPSLKYNLAKYLNVSRGLRCKPDQIFITSGSLQSIFLVGSALINPGDRVMLEEPTFPNVISIFKGLRADLQPISVDQKGAKIEEWTSQAKLIHTTPACHYPLNYVMSNERRQELIQRAHDFGAIIIENDYEHEINYRGAPQNLIHSLDPNDRVIYMSTFNRLLHPSIRLGYMVVPEFLIAPIEAILKHTHRFVPPSLQWALNRFLEKAILHSHVENVHQTIKERWEVFSDTWFDLFQDRFPILTYFSRSLHVTALVPRSTPDLKLVEELEKNDLIAHPLSRCYWSKPAMNGLIMGYSSVHSKAIPRKIEQVHSILMDQLDQC